MASLVNEKSGLRRIQFTDSDGLRKSISLGKIPKRHAQVIKLHVEELVSAQISGHPVGDRTSKWISSLPQKMRQKLARVDLIAEQTCVLLSSFILSYIASRQDVAESTRKVWNQGLKKLTDYFGELRPLRNINAGHAAEWRQAMVNEGLAEATVRKYCGYAKQFFAIACERQMIPSNPFAKLKSAPIPNKSRQYMVTQEEAKQVLAACSDPEWQLMFALSRYGGLRCPSEHYELLWEDVDWEQNLIRIRSPKTKRYEGHESRVIPLFAELRPYLRQAFESAPDWATHVIAKQLASGNVRQRFTRMVKAAGLTPWPRITHNLRASRETELCEEYPAHVVLAWMGNSMAVARDHYLQVTSDHFDRAVHIPCREVRQEVAGSGNLIIPASGPDSGKKRLEPEIQASAASCDLLREKSGNVRKRKTGVDGNRTHLATFQPPHRF